MGSCVSVHKGPESAMRLRMTKTEKILIPSPIKEKPAENGDHTIADEAPKSYSGTSFRDVGSKEEMFFDSQPWLDSDMEDDFFSVNGDFTPSRGSTPLHHSFSTGAPLISRSLVEENAPGSTPESSSGDKKKRLSDLFKESLRIDHGIEDQDVKALKMDPKETTLELPPQSANRTPYVSGATSVCSSERTPNGEFKSQEKSINPVQCCLPRLRSVRGFSERKKNNNPIPSIG